MHKPNLQILTFHNFALSQCTETECAKMWNFFKFLKKSIKNEQKTAFDVKLLVLDKKNIKNIKALKEKQFNTIPQ